MSKTIVAIVNPAGAINPPGEIATGVDVILAVGGDGTLHEARMTMEDIKFMLLVVAGFMMANGDLVQQQSGKQAVCETLLAVLPLGTGSDYSRMMGWKANDVQGYSMAAAYALLTYKPCSVQIRSDVNGSWQTLSDLTILVVGKGCFFGGGMCVLPDSVVGDGALHASAFQGLGLWHFIWYGQQLRAGRIQEISGVSPLPLCKMLEIKHSNGCSKLLWELDGEPFGPASVVRVQLVADAIYLCSS
eukprot:gene3447-3718_t